MCVIEHDDATWLGGLCWELDGYRQALFPQQAADRLRAIAKRISHDGRILEEHAAQGAQLLEAYALELQHTATLSHVAARHNLLQIAATLLQVSREAPRSRHRIILTPQ